MNKKQKINILTFLILALFFIKSQPAHALPSHFDWRDNGGNFVSSVKDQGSCGGCWAFSSTAALESYTMIAQNQPGTDPDLSVQVLLSCGPSAIQGQGCSGGSLDSAADYFETTGLPLDTCYPFGGDSGVCSSACSNWQTSTYKIAHWGWVYPMYHPDINTLKNALVNYGPLPVEMNVYSDLYSYSGTAPYTVNPNATAVGAHGVLIVGYDDPGQYFIVKNSWGTGWGNAGYFNIAYSELNGLSSFANEALAYPPPSANVYVVTTSHQGGRGTMAFAGTGSNIVTAGQSAQIIVGERTGYSYSYTGTCGGSLNGTTYTTNPLTADCTIIMTSSPIVTPSAGIHGSINPSAPQAVTYNTSTQFTVTPDPGYTASVGGACGGTLSGTTYTTNAITLPCDVTASFSLAGAITPPSAPTGLNVF